MKYYVYVLYSEKHNRFYRGLTQDVENRLEEHNRGKMRSTKGYIPWKLVYQEECESRVKAREREKFLKSGDGRKYVESLL